MDNREVVEGKIIDYKPSARFDEKVVEPENNYYYSNTKISFDCHLNECKDVCIKETDNLKSGIPRSQECDTCIRDCEEKKIYETKSKIEIK